MYIQLLMQRTLAGKPMLLVGLMSPARAASLCAIVVLSSATFCHAEAQCTPPPAGIVSWFRAEDDAADFVGTNFGTLVNGATFAPGMVGQAFSLDGTDDDVSLPAQPVSSLIASSFTIEFWARARVGTDRPTFGFAGSSGANTLNPIASYDSFLTFGDGGGGYQLMAPLPDASSASWAHYAVVSDGVAYRVYVNGALIDSAPISVYPNSGVRTFLIGQSGFCCGFEDHFNGFIDEFTIYDRGLSAAEIQAIYDAGSAGKCTSMDTDGDGLHDDDEISVYFTEPNDPDTDDDGLLDGVEVLDTLTNPLVADTDGDGLTDGAEVGLGTNPNNWDTDGDGVSDSQDPTPLSPGVPGSWVEGSLRDLAEGVLALSLTLFDAPNNNAAAGRRNALSNKLSTAANLVADGDRFGAIDELNSLLAKIDSLPGPADWIVDGAEKDALYAQVQLMVYLLGVP